MRKTTALLSAGTIGVVAVGAGAAAPAAAVVDTPCETFADHESIGDPSDNWYMECIPQYGLGKVEFTLDAPDSGFPDGFDPLTATRSNSPDSSGVNPYFQGTGSFFGGSFDDVDSWIQPLAVDTDNSTDTSLHLLGSVVAPVTSAASISTVPDAVLAACGFDAEDVFSAYATTYAPVATTFSFVGEDGVTYSARVSTSPDPTYYVFTGDLADVAGPICVTDLIQTAVGDPDADISDFIGVILGLFQVPPHVWAIDAETLSDPETALASLPTLGDASFAPPAPAAAPELAATGAADTTPFVAGAGLMAALGTLLTVVAARRRRRLG